MKDTSTVISSGRPPPHMMSLSFAKTAPWRGRLFDRRVPGGAQWQGVPEGIGLSNLGAQQDNASLQPRQER
eukprot:scaffold266237_cov36-Tisochrysis_lutea.AAC.3